MYNEFIDVPLGMKVLESYEIQDTDIYNDMVVLFFYGLVSCCRFAVFYTQLIPHLNNCFYRSSNTHWKIIQLACLLVIYLGSSSELAAQKVKES